MTASTVLRLLLDSHTLFWAVSDVPALSPRARTLILDQDNEVFFSPVSLYELVFKAHRGRAPAAALRLPEAAIASGFVELALTSRHLLHAARLDWDHGRSMGPHPGRPGDAGGPAAGVRR